MHELGLTENLLRQAEGQATKAHAKKIRALNIVLGDAAGVSEESVRFYFDSLSPGTMAEGAALNFKPVVGRDFHLESMDIE